MVVRPKIWKKCCEKYRNIAKFLAPFMKRVCHHPMTLDFLKWLLELATQTWNFLLWSPKFWIEILVRGLSNQRWNNFSVGAKGAKFRGLKSKSPTLSFFSKKKPSLFFKNFKQSTEWFKLRCFDDQIKVAFITLAKFIKTAISLTKNNCTSLKPFCDFAKVKAGCFVFSFSKNNHFWCV